MRFFELVCEPVDQAHVEVFTAEVCVATGRLDVENTTRNLEDRDIERSPTQVINGYFFRMTLVEPIGQGSCGRLVQDALDRETGNGPCVFGRLSLRVVEVRRHRYNRLFYFLAQIRLGDLLHLQQDHARDLRGARDCG